MKKNNPKSAEVKETSVKKCLLIGTIVTFVALVFHIIGFGMSSWITVDRGIYTEHFGIWKICTGNPSECYSAPSSGWMRAVQSFAVLGFVSLFVCVIVSIVLQCPCKQDTLKWILLVLGVIAIFGVISLLLCIAIFSSQKDELIIGSPPQSFGSSFALSITAMILAIIATVCFIVECIFTKE